MFFLSNYILTIFITNQPRHFFIMKLRCFMGSRKEGLSSWIVDTFSTMGLGLGRWVRVPTDIEPKINLKINPKIVSRFNSLNGCSAILSYLDQYHLDSFEFILQLSQYSSKCKLLYYLEQSPLQLYVSIRSRSHLTWHW